MKPLPSDDILDLLTAYALGALDAADMARITELLEHDAELQALYAELRVTTDRLPYALPVSDPPPELRQKVLDHAFGRTSATSNSLLPSVHQATQRLRRWLVGIGSLAAGAAVAAVIILVQLLAVRGELDRTRAALQHEQALNAQVAQVISSQPNQIVLSGTAGSGTMLRNAHNQMVLATTLPPLPSDQVYQLWYIDGGAPISAGTFSVDQQGHGLMALESAAVANGSFAITSEPGPNGSPQPTTPIVISNLPPS